MMVARALLVLVSAAAAIAGVALDPGSVWQHAAGIWFLLAVPGIALVPLLRIGDALHAGALAIGLSLALDTLVAEALVYAHLWSPLLAVLLLSGISAVGLALQARRPAPLGQERIAPPR